MSNKLCNKLGNKTPSYLTNRNGIFYFCYRVPSSLVDKPRVLRYSLRTRDALIAKQRQSKLIDVITSAKEASQNRNTDKLTAILAPFDTGMTNRIKGIQMDDSDKSLLQIKRGFLEIAINNLESYEDDYLDKIENYENSSSELSDNYCSDLNEYLSSSLIERSIAFKMVVSDLVEDIKNNSDKLEPCFYARFKPIYDEYGEDFLRETLKMYFNTHWKMPMELGEAMISDDTNRLNAISADLNSKYQRVLTETTIADLKEKLTNQQVIQQSQPIKQEQDLPVISHYIPDFLSWDERSRSEDIINGYKRDLEFLIFSIGDKPVNRVTKQDIKESLQIKSEMPKMSLKPYKEQGLKAVVYAIKNDLIEIPEEHRVSSKSVRETLKSYQSFFSAYLFKSKDILTKSPTENVTFKYQSIPYANYTDLQMNSIVSYYEQQEISDKQLVVLTACYTGMRLSEICNLTSESVKHDTESGYNYIFIEKGKTDAARRVIPISKKLEATGLIEYLNQLRPNQKLYSKKPELINDELRKARETLAIPHENEYEQRRVFHSLRHSLITKARSKGITDPVLQKVVGHQTNKTITDRYTHVFPVQDLTCVVECLPW